MKGTAEIKRPLSDEARLNLHRFIVEHRIMDRIRAHQAQQAEAQRKGHKRCNPHHTPSASRSYLELLLISGSTRKYSVK